MEESSFELDSRQIRTLVSGYPTKHREVRSAHPDADMSYLGASPSHEFLDHCWDECGH